MLNQEIIRKKQEGLELSSAEIESFFLAYGQGEVADYQMSAMLMAIYFQGLSFEETCCLTQLMTHSGTVMAWPQLDQSLIADKHSSGGVGDKTSFILLPLCLLEGLKVPMIAGRGLGHTGGTIDKLESISGLQLTMSQKRLQEQLDAVGGFIIEANKQICPLDGKLYALRDVTSCVASIPLIVSSILSKKLAAGVKHLVLDVKHGSGAFLTDYKQARKLAQYLVKVGQLSGMKVQAVLSHMNDPLGQFAGNRLELYESIKLLQGQGPEDTQALSIDLACQMILSCKAKQSQISKQELINKLQGHLRSGRAYEMFSKLIASQGGSQKELDQCSQRVETKYQVDVCSSQSGHVKSIDVRKLGLAILALGGGRNKKEDRIDYDVGLEFFKKTHEPVAKGEALLKIYAQNQQSADRAKLLVEEAYAISEEAKASAEKEPLMAEWIN